MITESVTVFRNPVDHMGNKNHDVHGTVEGLFAWGQSSGTSSYNTATGFKGENNSTTAQIYVARGTDLKDKDRIRRSNGDEFRVVGRSSWDQDFPFDGFDFGWTVFQVVSM